MKLDRRDAESIARKLQAALKPGRKHDLAHIRYDGKLIASFGIRRGSGSLPHLHILNQLHVSFSQARLLVDCPMSFEDWIALMKEKLVIPADSDYRSNTVRSEGASKRGGKPN